MSAIETSAQQAFDNATGRQIYPSIIQAGLFRLATILEEQASYHDVLSVRSTLQEVAGWLRGER